MIKNIYIFKDKVAGYAIDHVLSDISPEVAPTIFKRQCLMQPNPMYRDAEVYLVGTMDDESLELHNINNQFITNFDECFEKLDLIAEKKKILADAKKEAERIVAQAKEGGSQDA